MIPYEKFSQVYDKMGHDRFSHRMAEYTLEILKRNRFEPDNGLDLCCGTGTAIRVLAESGIAMSGLDGSTHMLTVARKKLGKKAVRFYHQRIPRFEIFQPAGKGKRRLARYDLVTSFFDSLNYLLTERDLKAAYRSVYRHLRPGGWFVFDMNTPYMLKTVFTDQRPYSGVQKDLAWIFRNAYTPKNRRSALTLTFFVKDGRDWKRFDEVHRERAYSNTTIKTMLREVGFQIKGFYGCFTFDGPTRTTGKIAVAARRPN